ncbi:MAG: metal-dependent phosphohydrolase, partial [Alphaproteobacteria bacterium]|nr:metal-dependent phosphohydrolase [Alphaproteobacteria bacterium]
MSTADSCINSAAVLFANDISKTLNIGINKLTISKIFSFLLGIFATYLAIIKTDLLSIVMTSASFYMAVVTVPLLLTILGFRSTKKSVSAAMVAGFLVVLVGNIFEVKADTILIGMLINMLVLFGFHYIFKQAGGWVGIKDYSYLEKSKKENN